MSSTRPEMHNLSRCRQRRIEQRHSATVVEDRAYGCRDMRADRQTDTRHSNSHPSRGEVRIVYVLQVTDEVRPAEKWCSNESPGPVLGDVAI